MTPLTDAEIEERFGQQIQDMLTELRTDPKFLVELGERAARAKAYWPDFKPGTRVLPPRTEKPPKPQPLTRSEKIDQKHREARRLREQGLTLVEVGKRLGLSPQGVQWALLKDGKPIGRVESKERLAKLDHREQLICALLKSGVTGKKIAKQLGVSTGTVSRTRSKLTAEGKL